MDGVARSHSNLLSITIVKVEPDPGQTQTEYLSNGELVEEEISLVNHRSNKVSIDCPSTALARLY